MADSIETQIQNTLDKIRPFLQRDGGDVEYIGFKDGIVYVRMGGACEGCSLASEDISAGVEIILMEEVPGVIQVKTTEIPDDLMKAYEDRQLAAAEAAMKK
jgi:Fe-S cluster biogenesis protein NfuA